MEKWGLYNSYTIGEKGKIGKQEESGSKRLKNERKWETRYEEFIMNNLKKALELYGSNTIGESEIGKLDK